MGLSRLHRLDSQYIRRPGMFFLFPSRHLQRQSSLDGCLRVSPTFVIARNRWLSRQSNEFAQSASIKDFALSLGLFLSFLNSFFPVITHSLLDATWLPGGAVVTTGANTTACGVFGVVARGITASLFATATLPGHDSGHHRIAPRKPRSLEQGRNWRIPPLLVLTLLVNDGTIEI